MNDYLFDADLAIKNEMVQALRDIVTIEGLLNNYNEYEHYEI